MLRQTSETLLYALILGLPFEGYFYTATESLYSTLKLQLLLFLGCWSVMKIVEASRSPGPIARSLRPSLASGLLLASLGYIVSQVLAAMLAPDFRLNAAKAALKAVLGIVVLIAVADLSRRTEDRSHTGVRFLTALSIAGFCTVVIGLGVHAGIPFFKHLAEVFQYGDHVVAGRPRFRSTMENPNTAAHFLVASLAATISLGLLRKAQLPGLWLASAGAQAVAIFLTYSRGALGAAFLALVTALWFFRDAFVKKWWRWAIAATVVVLLAGMGYAVWLRDARNDIKPPVSGDTIARYSFPATAAVRYLSPNQDKPETMMVRNNSSTRWEAERVQVSYRWYVFGTGQQSALMDGAMLTSDVLPGEERRVDAILKTPARAGEYTLVWFIARRDSEIKEFDRSHSQPQLIIVHDDRNGPPPVPTGEAWRLAQNLKQEREAEVQNRVPDRWSLWRAAIKMFRERPWFGLGPDSFRLLKRKYMEFPAGDDTILANSLYLEFLAGSGLIGLLSLLWLIFEVGRVLWAKLRQPLSPDDRAIAFYGVTYFLAFMLHGSVDYFLKFTPTFLLFWISLGVVCASDNDPDENRI